MDYINETQDKLIILHTIKRLSKSITNLQMVDLILETTGIDYFSLQTLLLELQDKKLISLISTSENKYYKITEDGEEMLASLANLIPGFLLKRINTKINAIQKKLEQKTVIWADYTPISDDSFIVDCKISENDQILINLSLNVPTKEQAIHICNKWYENPSRYYADIIKIFG
ncbi:MAG: DUF4364 family protein [Clostridiales bacterium]|nr:DUF4364 family protein [Clostridiales bacterium]